MSGFLLHASCNASFKLGKAALGLDIWEEFWITGVGKQLQ